KFAVDAVTAALGADLPSDAAPFGLNIEQTVIAAAICLALIIAGRAASNYLATISFAKVGARIATELRTRVFDHLQALSLRYHSRASIGDPPSAWWGTWAGSRTPPSPPACRW